MNVDVKFDKKKIEQKVTNDKFGLFVSNEWKRLIDPYTPRDTGTLMQSAKLSQFQIHYIQPYATRIYYGKGFEFKKKNPYSTYEWDKAAANAGQLNKLYRTINSALESGKI